MRGRGGTPDPDKSLYAVCVPFVVPGDWEGVVLQPWAVRIFRIRRPQAEKFSEHKSAMLYVSALEEYFLSEWDHFSVLSLASWRTYKFVEIFHKIKIKVKQQMNVERVGRFPLIPIYKYTKNLCNLQTISELICKKRMWMQLFLQGEWGGESLLRMEIEVVRDGLPWEGK